MGSELHLKVFDTRFLVRGDPAWLDLMNELWRPFRSRPNGRTVTIDIRSLADGWRIAVGGDKLLRGSDPWVLSGDLRHLIIQRAMADSRRFVALHAAVVARGRDALVLAGASRAGKTTLSLELVARGWRLVSDDIAALDRTSGALAPFLKPVSIKDASAFGAFRHRWRIPAWAGEPEGEFLVPASAVSSSRERLYRPCGVVFLERQSVASASLTRISAAHATALLWRGAGRLERAAQLAALVRFCGSTNNAALTYSRTSDAADAVEDFWNRSW
jgi:hypothetical protein